MEEDFLRELAELMERHDASFEPSNKYITFDSAYWNSTVACDDGIITPSEIYSKLEENAS